MLLSWNSVSSHLIFDNTYNNISYYKIVEIVSPVLDSHIQIYRRRPVGEYRRPLSLRDLSRGTLPKKIKEKVFNKL